MEDEIRPLLLLSPTSRSSTSLLPWDPRRAKKSGIYILISVTLERFAFYAVVMNLFLYLNKEQPELPFKTSWEPMQAITAVYIINGVSYMSAPIGGWLSDSLMGRYWAVIFGKIIYIVGYILLTLLSFNGLNFLGCTRSPIKKNSSHNCFAAGSESYVWAICIYMIMILIGLGVGCLRANIPPFGAEQVRAQGENVIRQFFNTYYWCVNIGSMFGIGILAFIEQNVVDGFFISYIMATIALFGSLISFCLGRYYYVVHRPGSSILKNIFRIIVEGVYYSCKKPESVQGSPVFSRRRLQQVSLVALNSSWIDRAKISHGGSFHDATVDDVKHLGTTLAYITLLIPYWLVYFQMATSFQAQGLHMRAVLNQTLLHDTFEAPSAWLTLCDQIFILFLIPLLNFIVYPLLDKRNIKTIPIYRIAVGMVVSVLAVLSAAFVEHYRLQEWQKGNSIIQIISNTSYNASSLPILWQIPQYCLMGTAEVFTGVAGLEYAYNSAPRSFQGIIMGLYAALEGLGSLLGIALVQLTNSLHLDWITNEKQFNQGHLDYFYYLLAVIQCLVIIILGTVIYTRLEPPERDSQLEETLGSSALHSEYYNEETRSEIVASNP